MRDDRNVSQPVAVVPKPNGESAEENKCPKTYEPRKKTAYEQ